MARSQFYLLTIGIIMLIILGFIYYLNLVTNEVFYFFNYYKDLPKFYEIKSYLEDFQKVFYLSNISLVKIRVLYYCNTSNISISNPFNSSNVAVFDINFNYLPTSFDNRSINFTIISKTHLYNNTCVFDGYIGSSPYFIVKVPINGSMPIETYYLYNFTVDDLAPFFYLFRKYNVIIIFDGNCTRIKMKQPEVEVFLPSYSLSILNVSIVGINGNSITLNITNIGSCPINLNNFMYFTNSSLYQIKLDNPILYPNRTVTYTFTNYKGTFCFVSLGFSKCVI